LLNVTQRKTKIAKVKLAKNQEFFQIIFHWISFAIVYRKRKPEIKKAKLREKLFNLFIFPLKQSESKGKNQKLNENGKKKSVTTIPKNCRFFIGIRCGAKVINKFYFYLTLSHYFFTVCLSANKPLSHHFSFETSFPFHFKENY
jgi:hypothetical protein